MTITPPLADPEDMDWSLLFEKMNALQRRYPLLVRLFMRPDGSGYIYGDNELIKFNLIYFSDLAGLKRVLTEEWDKAVTMFDAQFLTLPTPPQKGKK